MILHSLPFRENTLSLSVPPIRYIVAGQQNTQKLKDTYFFVAFTVFRFELLNIPT